MIWVRSFSLKELAEQFHVPEPELDLIAVANGIPVERAPDGLGLDRIPAGHYARLKAIVEGREVCERCGNTGRVDLSDRYSHHTAICDCQEANSV